MAESNISQEEADEFIAMEKIRISEQEYEFPLLGGKIVIPLLSSDKGVEYLLDIEHITIRLFKGKYQNRVRDNIILLRLCFGARPPHRNPDDQDIPSPHLHIYREGYGDKWAIPVMADKFPNVNVPWECLNDFMKYSNIIKPPNIRRGLFS